MAKATSRIGRNKLLPVLSGSKPTHNFQGKMGGPGANGGRPSAFSQEKNRMRRARQHVRPMVAH